MNSSSAPGIVAREMYECGGPYTTQCNAVLDNVSGCCPSNRFCSAYGCVRANQDEIMFVSSNRMFWATAGVQAIIIFVGVIEFALGTIYYRFRRYRSNARVKRSKDSNAVVNEDSEIAAEAKRYQLKKVAELSGRCCGCGGVSDTVLLPCRHAVCCFSCSSHAKVCPFCNAPSTSVQRLFPV